MFKPAQATLVIREFSSEMMQSLNRKILVQNALGLRKAVYSRQRLSSSPLAGPLGHDVSVHVLQPHK